MAKPGRAILFFAALSLAVAGLALAWRGFPGQFDAQLPAEDEFGRSLYAAALASLAKSYVEAALSAVVAVTIPLIVAALAASRDAPALRLAVHGAARVLDAIPLFLWVTLIFSTLGLQGYWGRQVAIVVAAFPFTLGLVLERFVQVGRLPFVQNARACGVGLPERLLRLVAPNSVSSLYYPLVVVFGLGLTLDAVLGLLGMSSRTELSLGTLLWRAKERAAVDPILSILAIAAMLATILLFALLRRLVAARSAVPAQPTGPAELTMP